MSQTASRRVDVHQCIWVSVPPAMPLTHSHWRLGCQWRAAAARRLRAATFWRLGGSAACCQLHSSTTGVADRKPLPKNQAHRRSGRTYCRFLTRAWSEGRRLRTWRLVTACCSPLLDGPQTEAVPCTRARGPHFLLLSL